MYEGSFSLGARCSSEFAATALMIFLGLGTLANELLAKTKGHGMGYVSQHALFDCSFITPLCSMLGCRPLLLCAPARQLVLDTDRACRFFAVAFGFAFALFVSLICFNHISANMNPASVLGMLPIRRL